jgi:hypothetical protein
MDCDDLLQVLAILEVAVAAFQHYLAFLQDDYSVHQVQKVHGMSDENACFVLELLQKHIFEDLLLHIGVESRYGVVHQHDRPVAVDSPGEAHSGLLAPTEVDTFLSNLCQVPRREDLQVSSELADLYHVLVVLLIKGEPENNVLTDRFVLDPRVLLNEGKRLRDDNGGLGGLEFLLRVGFHSLGYQGIIDI